jgi:NitT/TauT family transport system substrate-binding protein
VLLLKRPCLSLVSRTANDIADLRGKLVGVTAPGSSSHLLLNYMMARAGLRKEDLSVAGIGTGASAVAAITSGKVDSAMMTEPARSLARKRSPELRTLVDSTTEEGCRAMCGSDTYPSACLYASADWLASNANIPRQLATALLRTIRWMQSHSAAETEQKVPAELRVHDSETYREGLATVVPVYSADGILPGQAPETVRRVLAASVPELRTPSFDLAKTYTNAYVRDLDL